MLWVIAEIYAILELQKNNLDTKKSCPREQLFVFTTRIFTFF